MKELHSTDETIVWRDPGELEPVYDLFTIRRESGQKNQHDKKKPTEEGD